MRESDNANQKERGEREIGLRRSGPASSASRACGCGTAAAAGRTTGCVYQDGVEEGVRDARERERDRERGRMCEMKNMNRQWTAGEHAQCQVPRLDGGIKHTSLSNTTPDESC